MPEADAPTTMSDEEFFAARREAMGDRYPGDEAMRRQDADDSAATREWTERQQVENAPATPAPAAAEPADWDARAWLRDTFKDDPRFNELSEADLSRLEAMANERRESLGNDVQAWASDYGADVAETLRGQIDDIRADHPELANVADADLGRAFDGLSSVDRAAAAGPIAETLRDADGAILDEVQVVVGTALDDVHDIIEARAEMPGGDTPEIEGMIETVDAAPDQVAEALDVERADHDAAWDKAEARIDAIEHGADPRSLHDHDTWQADPNAAATATPEA